MPIFMLVAGLPANTCKAAQDRSIVPLTNCVVFRNTVENNAISEILRSALDCKLRRDDHRKDSILLLHYGLVDFPGTTKRIRVHLSLEIEDLHTPPEQTVAHEGLVADQTVVHMEPGSGETSQLSLMENSVRSDSDFLIETKMNRSIIMPYHLEDNRYRHASGTRNRRELDDGEPETSGVSGAAKGAPPYPMVFQPGAGRALVLGAGQAIQIRERSNGRNNNNG